MAVDRRHLLQHLELAALAYGPDLVPPRGHATEQPARPVVRESTSDANPAPTKPTPQQPPQPTAQPAPRPATPRLAALPPVPADAAAEAAAPMPQPTSLADAERGLAELRKQAMPCTRCKLHEGRQHVVFGEGNPAAQVMFVGEAPGATEDQTGRPFVGAAGQLLDKIITGAMGLQRSDVYIANINKCRPPGNREPAPEEVAACLPFLRAQIGWIRPKVIVCLGRTAAQNLLGSHESTTKMRGRTHDYLGVPVVVTWHPAYLLRDPSHKRETWDDIKRVNLLLGRPEVPPPAGP